MDPIEQIFEVMARGGKRLYGTREQVTQLAHALQCATLAEREGASPALISAALLHDIGHLLNPDEWAALERGEDAKHEDRGRDYLTQWFDDDVVMPVYWHVAAKRYLTATEPDYFDRLSAGSVRTLELQGGPFTADEAVEFAAQPYADDGVRVRRWDEGGKVVGAETPDLAHFRPHLESCLRT